MKIPILVSVFVALATSLASAAEMSVFRVCQDQRVIRTSDGVEAGRVEYIVVDPASREVVSTIVSGGVEGDRLVAIPYTSLRFEGDRGIVLNEITRERLVSAPVIERSQITTAVIQPEIIQRATTHFSVRAETNAPRNGRENGAAAVPGTSESRTSGQATTRSNGPSSRGNAEQPNGNRGPAANTNERNATNPGAETRGERPNANTENNNPRNQRNNRESQAEQERGATPNPNAENRKGLSEGTNPNAESRKERDEGTKPASPSAKSRKENATPAENRPESKQGNSPANESTKPARDANDRTNAQSERNEKSPAAPNEAEAKHPRKGTTDRNASEDSATGRKPAPAENQNEATSSKHPPKKSSESTSEKRDQRSQQP